MDLLDSIDVNAPTVMLGIMGSQKKTARKIKIRGRHYVLPLKDNQKKLYMHYKESHAFFIRLNMIIIKITDRYIELTDSDHGRIEVRRYIQVEIIDWVSFADEWQDKKILIK